MGTPKPRGYGITKTDMEASRLVFVFVRDSKPRRKVAVPVPDDFTWEQFTDQVKLKLKLSGVADIYLSSSGQKIRHLDELQDIDELCVVEGPAHPDGYQNGMVDSTTVPGPLNETGPSSVSEIVPQPSIPHHQQVAQDKHKVVVADGEVGTSNQEQQQKEDLQKYVKRTSSTRRTLQRFFPIFFPPYTSLPITTRDTIDGDVKTPGKRKRRRGGFSKQNSLLFVAILSCLATMVYLYLKVTSHLQT